MKKLLVPINTALVLGFSTAQALAAGTGGNVSAGAPGNAGSISIPRVGPVHIDSIGTLIGAVLGILLIVSAILAFVYLILGGIQWITSGGDKAGMEAARNKITNAIVGLIIVASAWAVMLLASQFLGVEGLFGGGLDIPRAF